jgi:hypothetical protein
MMRLLDGFTPQPGQGASFCPDDLKPLALDVIERVRDLRSGLARAWGAVWFSRDEKGYSPSDGSIEAFIGPETGAEFLGELLLIMGEALGSVSVPVHQAVSAALVARNAAIEGDADTVDDFSRTWLGLSHPARWREAVEMALLGDWVNTLGKKTTDRNIHDLLRRHAHAEHRSLQPLWERRVRGKRTALLGQPLGEAGWTVEDLLVERRTPESEVLAAELGDGRLVTVLGKLTPDEQAAARAWATFGVSWDQAALAVHKQQAFGERVRRKLKRLGARHAGRATAAYETRERTDDS